MSIFVWSTRETDSGRNLLAATASFSALLFAASPTISTRSGMSRATFSALSPIDPVAPRITTRLRFIFRQNGQNERNGFLQRIQSEADSVFGKRNFFFKLEACHTKIQQQSFVDP